MMESILATKLRFCVAQNMKITVAAGRYLLRIRNKILKKKVGTAFISKLVHYSFILVAQI